MNKERWQTLTLGQQLGNIGAEIARARLAEEKSDLSFKRQSLERAFDLIDLTVDDKRWRGRYKEILRLREVVADWYGGTEVFDISPLSLENYCVQFAFLS